MTMQGEPTFWPPLEEEQLEDVRHNVERRLIEARQLAWRVLLARACGLHEMPPRHRLLLYSALAQRAMQEGGTILDALMVLERINAEEAAWMAKDIAHLLKANVVAPPKRNGASPVPVEAY